MTKYKNNFDPNVIDPVVNSGKNGTWRKMEQELLSKLPKIIGWKVFYENLSFNSDIFSWNELPKHGVQVLMIFFDNGAKCQFVGYDEYCIYNNKQTIFGLMIEEQKFNKIAWDAMNDSWRPKS